MVERLGKVVVRTLSSRQIPPWYVLAVSRITGMNGSEGSAPAASPSQSRDTGIMTSSRMRSGSADLTFSSVCPSPAVITP
jgi:hypothetical protein